MQHIHRQSCVLTLCMQADALQYPGNQWCRYCFQCAKVEPLTCFDGNKRYDEHELELVIDGSGVAPQAAATGLIMRNHLVVRLDG